MINIFRVMGIIICLFGILSEDVCYPSRLKVHVSIQPQKFFVERLVKEKGDVEVLINPGKSPVIYSPSPDQIKRLIQSDIYFRIGVPFENGLLYKIRNIAPDLMIVDARQDILSRDIKQSYNNSDSSQETGQDPHIWMNPVLLKIQVRTMLNTLVKFDKENQLFYESNFREIIKDLDVLHESLTLILAPFKGSNFFVFHPAFGYFAEQYGLHQIAVEKMGRSPRGRELSSIIKMAKQQKLKVIFAEPQFDQTAVQKIAKTINGSVIFIDPLAYDYLSNMETIANEIVKGLNKDLTQTELK